MSTEGQPPASSPDLGPQLEPALEEACGGKLREVHWFRADWQRSGAATAYGVYEVGPGDERGVVVKLPVGWREYRFTTLLSEREDPHFPRLAAHGTELGGYDLAWLVMERLPGDPLAANLHKDVFRALATAAGSFYRHALEVVPECPAPRPTDWGSLLERGREAIRTSHIPDEQRWVNAVKAVQKALPKLAGAWDARPVTGWCHGDLHAGNLMQREDGSPWGPGSAVLLDMAETHPGHWVEDAVYLERLYWGTPDVLKGVKVPSLIRKARREQGFDPEGEGDTTVLANVRRVLLAACVPAFLHREGHPAYLRGALDVLERVTPQVA